MPHTKNRNPNFSEPVEIPDHWAQALKNAGLVSPVTDEPSIQQLSKASGVHASAISRIISGRTRHPRSHTLDQIAKALGIHTVEVAAWIGKQWNIFEPWTPPAKAHRMTPRQRDIVEALIKEMVADELSDDVHEGDHNDQDT